MEGREEYVKKKILMRGIDSAVIELDRSAPDKNADALRSVPLRRSIMSTREFLATLFTCS